MDIISSLIAATIIAITSMTILWLWYLKADNPSVVDIGFGGNVALILLWYMYTIETLTYWTCILLIPGIVWAIRLSWYLGKRNLSGHLDGRYVEISKRWSHKNLPLTYFFFFQFQAILDVILTIPFLLVLQASQPINTLSIFGAALALISILGESIADMQLKKFKSDPENRGKVLMTGLWKYSRHPNYFFELLFWVSIAIMATPYQWGFIAWINPLIMAHFLLNVTGIPETEAQNIRTKGDEYRTYQKRTSMLIPLPPKKD